MRATIELRIPLSNQPRPKTVAVAAGTYRRHTSWGRRELLAVPAQVGRVEGWCDDHPNCHTRVMVVVECEAA